jgi:hypothetical protein
MTKKLLLPLQGNPKQSATSCYLTSAVAPSYPYLLYCVIAVLLVLWICFILISCLINLLIASLLKKKKKKKNGVLGL